MSKARTNIISIFSLKERENQTCPSETTGTYSNVLFHKPYPCGKAALPSNPSLKRCSRTQLDHMKKRGIICSSNGETQIALWFQGFLR